MFSTGYKSQTQEQVFEIGGFCFRVLVSYSTCVGFRGDSGYFFDDYTYSNTTARHITEFCGMNKRERQKGGCSLVNFKDEFFGYILGKIAPEAISFEEIDEQKRYKVLRFMANYMNTGFDKTESTADDLLRRNMREKLEEATQQTTNATKQAKRI